MQRMLSRGLVTIFLLALGALSVSAQRQDDTDICVLEHLTAHALTGKIVSAKFEAEIEKPLAGATVELRRIGEQEVIARTRTDASGHFAFREIPPGAYSLAAKPPASYRVALFATAVEVRLGKAKLDKQHKEIVLALGWLFNGCHGGYAGVRKKESTSVK